MTPTPIEAAHGRKLIAVVVPKEADKFEITQSFLSKRVFYEKEGYALGGSIPLNTEEDVAVLGTLHHDGEKWVSSFDVEPFVEKGESKDGDEPIIRYFDYYGFNHSISQNKDDWFYVPTAIDAFIYLLNSYGVGYLNNPLGERPSPSNYESLQEPTVQSPDDTERYNGDLSAWLKAEGGVLQPNQQIVFIEQLNP